MRGSAGEHQEVNRERLLRVEKHCRNGRRLPPIAPAAMAAMAESRQRHGQPGRIQASLVPRLKPQTETSHLPALRGVQGKSPRSPV